MVLDFDALNITSPLTTADPVVPYLALTAPTVFERAPTSAVSLNLTYLPVVPVIFGNPAERV